MPYRVIQGHRFLYQSKAHIRLQVLMCLILKPRLHDTTCCQTGCQSGCIVHRLRTFNRLSNNPFDNRLYRVYSRLSNRLYNPVRQPVERTVAVCSTVERTVTVRSTRLSNFQRMSKDGQSTKWRRNIAENFNRLSRRRSVTDDTVTTDRRTDDSI